MSDKVIQSYVWHEKECFFVSTIERDSSAMLAPGRYNETIVWEYDYDARKRGELVFQDEDSKGRIVKHLILCENIVKIGRKAFEDKP